MQRLRDVLLIALVYPPDPYTGAARIHRLRKYLQKLGHSVDVLAATPSYTPIEQDGVHRVHCYMDHAPERTLGARLERIFRSVATPADEGITWVPRAVRYASRWMQGSSKPVVISSSPPFTAHLIAQQLKRKYGVKWIADFRDPLVSSWGRHATVQKLLDPALERFIFGRADALIANTEPAGELWRGTYPAFRNKVHVLWNGFDPEEAPKALPIPHRPYRVLAHVGNAYASRRPGPLFASILRMIQRGTLTRDNFRLQLWGYFDFGLVPEPGLVDSLKASGCLEGPVKLPRDEAMRIAGESDYLLLIDATSEGPNVQLPMKTFEYVCIGRPILAYTKRDNPSEWILQRAGVPYRAVYHGATADEIDRAVEDFLQMPTEPVRASDWYWQTFSGDAQAKTLSKLVQAV